MTGCCNLQHLKLSIVATQACFQWLVTVAMSHIELLRKASPCLAQSGTMFKALEGSTC